MSCYSVNFISLFSGQQCHLADAFCPGFTAEGKNDLIPSTQVLKPDLKGKFTLCLQQMEPLAWLGVKCRLWDPLILCMGSVTP